MYVSNTNPHTFFAELIRAIKDGWRVIPSNEGYISQAFLLEIKLFPKQEDEEIIPLFTDYKIKIEEWDSMTFLLLCQNALLSGYEFDMKSLDWNNHALKRIKAENPSHPKAKVYTREELDAMPWDSLRELFQSYGIRGRQREVVTQQLMKAQQEANQ